MQIEQPHAPQMQGGAPQNSWNNSMPLNERLVTSCSYIHHDFEPTWYMCRSSLNGMFATQYPIVALIARFVSFIMSAHFEHTLAQKRIWLHSAIFSCTSYLGYMLVINK